MEIVAAYRRRAFEVEQFALTVVSEEDRRMVLEMARSWRTMAEQRELHLLRTGRGERLELERRPLAPNEQQGWGIAVRQDVYKIPAKEP